MSTFDKIILRYSNGVNRKNSVIMFTRRLYLSLCLNKTVLVLVFNEKGDVCLVRNGVKVQSWQHTRNILAQEYISHFRANRWL